MSFAATPSAFNPREMKKSSGKYPGFSQAAGLPGRRSAGASSCRTRRLLQLPDPHIPESHRIAVILQRQRQCVRMRLVRRTLAERRRSSEHDVVLHQHAIVEYRHTRRARHTAAAGEARTMKDNVIRLPFAGLATGVHQRRILAEERCRLTVRIRAIVVRVEHLYLVQPHEKHAAVAALLSLAVRRRVRFPLAVQLTVAEPLSGLVR